MRRGLLLINLGTPDAPEPAPVRRYLREFLSDPRVIDIPALGRALLLNLFILPFRPRQSAEAYRKIWTDRGSPLLFHGQDLADGLRARLPESIPVALGMRYGSPSIETALGELRARGADTIVALPMFPQYSSAAWGSAAESLFESAGRLWNVPSIQLVPPFYDHPGFVRALATEMRPLLESEAPERWLISFHGVPERQVRKSDETGRHCLESDECCDRVVDANRNCYRAHCYATARALAHEVGLADDAWEVAFQSRLGRTPWIRPYTDERIRELAEAGVRRLAVTVPSFVADCLETVEEIGIRAREDFRAHGGEELWLVPSLNASAAWVEAILEMTGPLLGQPTETTVGPPTRDRRP